MNNRKEWIVSLRAFACIAVIMIHVIDGWTVSTDTQLTGSRFILDEIILQPLIRWAVPVFIMISGCLLLDPAKDITLIRIKKYIKRILYVLLSFALFYSVLESVYEYGSDDLPKAFFSGVFNTIQGKSWAAMWYLYLLIGLYMITPLLRHFVKGASEEETRFVICCLAVFSVAVPTINSVFRINITTFYLSGLNYLLLYLLGYAAANHYFSEKDVYCLGFLGLTGYILCSAFGVLVGDQSGIFIVLISTAVFCFFANGHYRIPNGRIVELISKDSFGIYLIHTFWLNALYKGLHLYPDILPAGIGEIFFLFFALTASVISVECLRAIPFFRRIL